MMKKYAKLIADIGIGANSKQDVVIKAPAETYQFVRYLALELYNSKARSVSVDWSDGIIDKESLMHVSPSRLDLIPDWQKARENERIDKDFARISLIGEDPAIFRSVSPERLSRRNKAATEAFLDSHKVYMNNELAWCVVAAPTKAWAKKVFPTLSPTQAMLKLWNCIYQACYVDEDNDPVEVWKEHIATLRKHAEQMTAFHFVALHYTNSLGTDLTIGLPKGHLWAAARSVQSRNGLVFTPNIPTEEVFSMPDRTRINGKVFSSRPLSNNGVMIEDFWVRFQNGRAVEFDAKTGKEKLKEIINFDENSASLGEVALVPYSSPISQQKIIYQSTLFDENASCHLAFGASYSECLEGGDKMTEEEIFARGGNQSKTHVDFMVGTPDLRIDGIKEDGSSVPVFVDGNFAF